MQDIIKKILILSGISKTQFSKDLGISKSYVLNVINGTKKCSHSMYEKIRVLSYVPTALKEDLDNAYYSNLFGKEKYQLLKHYIDLWGMSETDFNESRNIFIRNDFVGGILSKKESIHTINGQAELFEFAVYMAKKCVETDSSFFYTNYSFAQSELDKLLFTVFRDRDYSRDLDFKHLINLDNTSPVDSIDIFYNSFKWARILFETKHSPNFSGNATYLFPYYIVSSFGIIMFDSTCDKGIILSSSSSVEYYSNVFLDIQKSFIPICFIINDEISCLGQTDIFSSMSSAKMSFGGLACFGPYCHKELLDDIAYDTPQKDFLVQMFMSHYSTLYSTPQKEYISESAYWEFVEDGNIHCVTDKYVNKCSPENRAKLLQNIIIGNKQENTITIKLLDDSKIKIPTNVTVDCFENNSVITMLFKDEPCTKVVTPYGIVLSVNHEEMYWFKELSENLCMYFEDRKLVLNDDSCINAFERMIAKCKGQ